MCIICFLNDRKQFLLRHSAMVRTDRFEHSLEIYKNEFIDEFINSNNQEMCEIHRNVDSNEYISKALKKIKTKDIEKFFIQIKETYIHWINTQVPEAIEKLKELVKVFALENFSEDLKTNLLFRGRFSSTFISHWDMFHIPFNRRFLIKNQRYSLIGQPILYFASSPYGVYKELGEYTNLRVARFKILNGNSFKIFENINKFSQYIDDFEENLEPIKEEGIESGKLDSMIDSEELNNEDYVNSMFYLMILSSCCSFSRRDDTIDKEFAEEYVVPQILTIALKQMGYEGIKYTSTKMNKDKVMNITNNKVKRILYSNYCIFTNYTLVDSGKKTNVYDRTLYTKFDISNVIPYKNSIDSELFKIDELFNLISKIDVIETEKVYNKDIAYILADDIERIKELSDCLDNSMVDEIKIINNFINMHILFIRDVLLEIESKGRSNDEEEF